MIYGILLILGFFNSRNIQRALLVDVDVKIPVELADEVDKIVEKNFLGYRGRPEFVSEAFRDKLIQVKKS